VGLRKDLVARAAFDALQRFDGLLQRGARHFIRRVRFVNNDQSTSDAFVSEFKHRLASLGSGRGDATSPYGAEQQHTPRPARIRRLKKPSNALDSSVVAGANVYLPPPDPTNVAASWEEEPTDDADAHSASNAHAAAAAAAASSEDSGGDEDGDEDCVICMCAMSDEKKLPCGHKFCTDCIDEYFRRCQPKCPSCGKLYGVMRGNQPPGTMDVRVVPNSLPGYDSYQTIRIEYNIPDGIQTVSIVVTVRLVVFGVKRIQLSCIQTFLNDGRLSVWKIADSDLIIGLNAIDLRAQNAAKGMS
jgi:hypothetical protein